MPPSTTDPQLAVLIERVEHIAKSMDDLKPLVSLITTLQRDQEYTASKLAQLNDLAKLRGEAAHKLDKRVLVLERWRTAMVAIPALALSFGIWASGYAISYLGSIEDFRGDTRQRLATLEFIINGPHFERAMEPESEQTVAAGSK